MIRSDPLDQVVAAPTRPRALSLQGVFGIGTVWVLLALLVPFIFPASNPIVGPDIWWTLKSGELMVESGRLITEDPFTFAPHASNFVNAQWLAQLGYYLPYRLLGLEGVALFNAGVITASFGLLLYLAWKRSGSIRVAALCTIAATAVAATNLNPRPQTLGFLLFMVSYCLLSTPTAPRLSLPALAGIAALWASTHGSFFLGPGLAGLLLAGTAVEVASDRGVRAVPASLRVRFLAGALATQALATLATPFGLATYQYVWHIGSDPIIRNFVTEWWPTTIRDVTGIAFFASVGATLVVIGLSRQRLGATDLLILLAFVALGLQTVRNVAWWALATAPILAVHLAHVPMPSRLKQIAARETSGSRQRPGLNALLAGLIVLAMASALPWIKEYNPLLPADKRGMVEAKAPQGAASFLLSRPRPARMLNYQGWGGYLDWRLWPHYQTMLDGRIEVHPPEVWLDYMYISFGHATWQERLDRYGIDLLVLSKEHQADLIGLADQSARWQRLYEDELAVIFGPGRADVPEAGLRRVPGTRCCPDQVGAPARTEA